jgi:hypothetical protein
MSTLQMQLKIWTARPSELLREVVGPGDQGQPDADELVKRGSFNGLFVIFTWLSQAQFHALEDAAARLSLKYDASQQADYTHQYDTRWYPKGTAYERGMHDAEIDVWHFKRITYPHRYGLITPTHIQEVQENTPQEAIMNRAARMWQVLEQFNAIPEHERSQEERETIAHNEGYLERVCQEFLLL